jgi:diaminohydroxyphosphoribosylaminopyrimidine deaminase/5-amino-6-(5-phosphoribosylamino)uracil reductase
MLSDENAISRCIQIARNGLGTTRPNPMVGAIIVHEHKIIGEGYTSPYGGPHAEVNAIRSVSDHELLKEATLYVTLEPCSHYGKTPPCTDLIIAKGIPKVVIGCVDDNPEVAGKGISKLKKAGCQVKTGVLENECKFLHRRFFTYWNKKRPYIILKWAETQDHFIAPDKKKKIAPVWITNLYSRQLVHKWRAQEQAILVGSHTVRDDNPSLNVRDWYGTDPLKFILGGSLNSNSDFKVFTSGSDSAMTFVNLKELISYLHSHEINSLLVEGGSRTIQSFIDSGLWDEARVFVGRKNFGSGVPAPQLSVPISQKNKIREDLLNFYYND